MSGTLRVKRLIWKCHCNQENLKGGNLKNEAHISPAVAMGFSQYSPAEHLTSPHYKA